MNKLCIKFDIAYNAYEIIILFNEIKPQTAEISMLKTVIGGIAKCHIFTYFNNYISAFRNAI